MKKRNLIVGITIAALLFSCGKDALVSSNDSKETSKIAGTIMPQKSKAKLYLEQGRAMDSVSIDPVDGYFALDNIQAGSYRLRIVAEGYDTFSTIISLQKGLSYEFGNLLLALRTKKFDDSIPSIYDHYPQKNAEVIYLPRDQYNVGSSRLFVSVSFDRPMDRKSVEKAFSINPSVDGGYFVWFQNTRTFTPVVSQNVSWDGGTYLEDKASTPSFSSSVRTVLDTFTPTAEISSFETVKSFTYYFPNAGCFTDTTYTIKIARTAVDTAGVALDSALQFSFKTVQSAIVYSDIETIPHNGDDWVDVICANGISITFPKRMNQKSVEEHLHINLGTKPVFLWKNYNVLTLYTGGIFIPDTTYEITFDSVTLDLGGNILGSEKIISFKTAPLSVLSTSPAKGQLGVNSGTNIQINFNSYMDITSFNSKLKCTSSDGTTVEGKIRYNFNPNGNYNNGKYDTTFYLNQIVFQPNAPLKRNSVYNVSVDQGVSDLSGYICKTGYELTFITMP